MILDLAVIGVLAACAVVGAFDGALLQGARLLAAAAAGLLGRPAGDALAPLALEHTGLPETFAGPAATALCCLVLYVLFHWLGRRIARGITENRDVRAVDRGAGALFGALQAAVIAWVFLSILVGLEEKVHVQLGGEGSLAARVARDHNFFVALRGAAPTPAAGAALAE